MTKVPKKVETDKTNDITVPVPLLQGLEIVWVELRIITDKNGKLKRTKTTWPNDDWMWTDYDEEGKPVKGTGGGKGWSTDWVITYDRKGRKKSTKTITKRGVRTTLTTQKFDPETGEMTDQRTKPYLDGLH